MIVIPFNILVLQSPKFPNPAAKAKHQLYRKAVGCLLREVFQMIQQSGPMLRQIYITGMIICFFEHQSFGRHHGNVNAWNVFGREEPGSQSIHRQEKARPGDGTITGNQIRIKYVSDL
jgi:hypothetical protein